LKTTQQQEASKKESNSEPFPFWFWPTTGLMIIGWVFWMKRIWRRKKSITKA
jgi:hypothetical protein